MSQTAAQRRTLEILDQGKPGDWASLISDWFFITLVLANITAVVLESVSALEARYAAEFALFELVSVLIFSAEYLLRLWATGAALPQRPWVARRRYVFGFYGLVDVLSIVPYYLAVLVPGLDLRVLRVHDLPCVVCTVLRGEWQATQPIEWNSSLPRSLEVSVLESVLLASAAGAESPVWSAVESR